MTDRFNARQSLQFPNGIDGPPPQLPHPTGGQVPTREQMIAEILQRQSQQGQPQQAKQSAGIEQPNRQQMIAEILAKQESGQTQPTGSPIVVEAPDGTEIEFPAGMAMEEITHVMRQNFPSPNGAVQYSEAELKAAAKRAYEDGNTASAKRLIAAARKAGEQEAGGGNPSTYAEMMEKAKELYAAGDVAGAKRLAQIALNRKPESHANDEPAMGFAQMEARAKFAASQGDTQEANRLYQAAYEAKAADGGLTAPEQGILSRLQAAGMESATQPAGPPLEGLERVMAPVHRAVKGASFGFGDEMAAASDALIGHGTDEPTFKGAYSDRLDYYRGLEKRHEAAYPKEALAAEVTGALAGPAGAGGAFVKGGKSVAGRTARGVATGAATGAAYGFGDGEGGLNNRAYEASKGAALGAVAGAALTPLGEGLGRVIDKVAGDPKLAVLTPSLQGLRDTADGLYKQLDSVTDGLDVKGVDRLARTVQGALTKAKYHPRLHRDLAPFVSELEDMAGKPATMANLMQLRRIASLGKKSPSPDEARLTSIAVKRLDEAIEGAGIGGNLPKEARAAWSTYRKAETVQQAIEKATNAASGFDKAIASQFRSILKSPSKRRGFNAEQIKAMEDIARGRGGVKALGWLARTFKPNGFNFGSVAAGASLLTGGLSPQALALPTMGIASEMVAKALSKNQTQGLRSMVAGSTGREVANALAARSNPLAPLNVLAGQQSAQRVKE